MKGASTFRIVLTAMFAALTCVATMCIRIPSPTGGYLNLGDGLAMLSGCLLGPLHGPLAAGIGSAMADLMAGYPAYAPGTLVIKGLSALTAGAVYRRLAGKKPRRVPVAMAGACGAAVMAAGYFLFEALFLGYGIGAAVELPGNLAQGAVGAAVAALLVPALLDSREIRELLDQF